MYVVDTQNTLYSVPSASCSEGDAINVSGLDYTTIQNVNGHFISGVSGTFTDNITMVCHDWSTFQYNPSFYLLPATLIMLCLFSCIYHWFLRLRG